MEMIKLKKTDISVSRLCMGGCPMGGYGWGNTQENDFLDAIHTALDNGINFFDTSDTYGLGQSEKTLAKGLGTSRKNAVIESKFGVRVVNGKTVYDNSPGYIVQALNDTLTRLKSDWVDIYTIHYRDGITPLSDVIETLLRCRTEGKIRYIGLSNILPEELPLLSEYKEAFVNVQEEYSLACRKNEKKLCDSANLLDINPMSWGSLGQGILTGKYSEKSTFGSDDRRSRDIYVNFHGDKLKKNLEIVEHLKKIAETHGKSVASCAIRFILDYIPDSIVLAGAKNASQIISNAEALGWHLDTEEIDELNRVSTAGDINDK